MLKEPKGSDAFARLLEKEASLSPLAKLQSGPAKVLKFTSVPLAAVGGFLATPKAAGGMFRVFGGVVGGFALKQLNQKLRSIRHSGAEVAVAHLLLDYESDISSLTPSAIKAVTAKYDVNYAEHLEIMRSLYTSFLLATLQWPEVRMNEPASLVDLSTALGLDSSTIGDAHCAAAEEIARMLAEVPFEEREEAWEQGMVGKLLFLSDRLYTQLEEEETREYELGRVTEILGLTPKEGVDKVQALVLPYYTSIVKDGMRQIRGGGGGEGEAMDGPKLVKWRQSLGVSEAQANRLHSEEFAKEVTRCVEAGQGRVRDGDADVLLKVRQLLGISSFESERALESVTAPLLRQSIVEMLTALTATPADTWPDALLKVRQRQKELKMVDSALVFHIKDVYRERLKGLIRQANEAAAPLEAAAAAAALEGKERGMEAGEGAKLRKTVGAAMLLMRLMRQFLEVNNLDEVMDEDLFNLKFLNLLPGELNKREREVTFRQYVSAVVSAKLVMEEGGAINELGMFLEMDPAYVKYTLKAMVGPIYEQKVREFVVEKKEMTDENQQVLLDIMRDFRVDDADVRRIGLAVYEAKVHEFFDGKKEFTEAELSELERVKGFLLLSDADVDRIHEPLARDEFLKVVKAEFVKQKTATATAAAPSTTGRAGGTSASLVALSRRLGLSEDARDELLGEALTTHVSPMLSNLKTTFRTLTTPAAELAEERGVDEGEDPFIKGRGKEGLMIKTDNTRNGNLLVEAVELVSFLEANEGYRATPMNLDDEGHMAKRSTDSAKGKRTVTSYVCKAAMGGGRAGEKGNKEKEEEAEESKLAEEMYKAFVQTVAGAAEGEKKERYRVVQDKFGAALGIHPPRMEALKFDLYASKMRKLVRSCLEIKGMMGADDNAELSLLNTQYAIGEERAGRLVLREKKKWLAGTLVSLIQAPPNVLGPTINKLRMTAANMGIDLSEDVPELTPGNKEFLFMKELAWLLEEGPEDADAETITDAVEQFGVEESSANRIILQEFNAASRQACVDLMGNMERSDYLGAFRDLGRLVRIGRCVPLPLAFNQEALLGMAVCGEVRRLWSSYAAVLGTTSAAVGGGSKGGIDLSAVIQGVNAEELAAFKAGFDEEDEIVGKLIGGLEALPETAGDIDLTIDYRGRKVTRKRPGGEDMMDNKEEWADGELEMMEKGGRKIVLGEDGKEMTILDIIRKAIDTRHTFMGQKKRRTGPKKKGEKPVNAQGRRAA